jgi:hypothetical protein
VEAQVGYFSCHKIFFNVTVLALISLYFFSLHFHFFRKYKGSCKSYLCYHVSECLKIHRLYRILLGTLVGGRPCYPPPQRRWRSLKNILPTEFYAWFYGSSNVLRSNYSVGRRLKVVPQGIVPIVRGEHYLCQ